MPSLCCFVFQSLSHVRLFATPWTAACQSPLPSSISWHLLPVMSIETVTLSNQLILCHPLLFLPSIFTASGLSEQVGSSYHGTSVINPFNEYSVLISFKIDLFDLLAVWKCHLNLGLITLWNNKQSFGYCNQKLSLFFTKPKGAYYKNMVDSDPLLL